MLKILKYIKKTEWLMALASLVFIVAQVWLDLKSPEYMQEITRLTQTPGSTMSEIWQTGGMMLLCTLGSLASAIIVGFFAARIAAGFSRDLRGRFYRRVDSFSSEEINRFSTASLITRATNDVTQIQLLITLGLMVLIKAPIMAVWAVGKIAGKGAEWTLATAVTVAILLFFVGLLMLLVFPKFKKMQTLTDNLNRVTRENLTGLRVVRAYNAENFQAGKFEDANEDLTSTQLFTGRAMALMMPVMMLIMNGLTLVIYLIGADLINKAALTNKLDVFSNMIVFSSYAMQVIMSFLMLVMIFMLLPRASVSARRINEVLETEPSITSGPDQEGSPGIHGALTFDKVSFKYPDAEDYILHDISFTANPGETVAFIGSTGSGKSTLVNLILRFYDITEGEIRINDKDIRQYTLKALRDKIGYVSQEAVIFKGSVSSNISLGDERTQGPSVEEIKKALEISQSTAFVEAMEDGLEAKIAQAGTNLSGGQKQRLSIARAIYRQPEFFIFDDSFSALDFQTDRLLRQALKQKTGEVTNLIVAQRIGTIMDADRIIVLDEGRIVGQGTHKELLADCSVYRQIAESQLSEEELAS